MPALASDPADAAPVPRTVAAAPVLERPPTDLTFLKRLLWFYLALWIVEGALRKWILPGLATPLLIVRDPFLLLLYAVAIQKGVFPRGLFMFWIGGLSLVALAFSLIGSRAPLVVQIFGFRADYLHLPLVFLIPNLFDRDDLRKIGKWTLLVALPMSLLVLLQFGSGSGSRLNVGVGGEGTMLDAAYGHIRPSGTFSFSNGLGDFTALVAAFCVYNLLEKKTYPRLLWLASLPALAALVLLSGSRGAVGLVVLVLLSVLLISLLRPRYFGATIQIVAVCTLAIVVAGSFAIFRDGMQVFAYRFGDASDVREGFVDRFFEAFLVPFRLFNAVDFYGVGLGMGTNVGSGLLFEGERKFLYAENELGRVMFESGPLVGPLFLLLRAFIVLFLFGQAVRTLRRDGNPLAMLLVGACGVETIQGQFGQATTLGYVTIACGLCLAANRPGASDEAAKPAAIPTPRVNPLLPPPGAVETLPNSGSARAPEPTTPRGRSLYAEQMRREAEEEGRRQKAEGRGPEEQADPPA